MYKSNVHTYDALNHEDHAIKHLLWVPVWRLCTVDWVFFACENFRLLIFSVVKFSSHEPISCSYYKYFACLIFIAIECRRKFINNENFQSTVSATRCNQKPIGSVKHETFVCWSCHSFQDNLLVNTTPILKGGRHINTIKRLEVTCCLAVSRAWLSLTGQSGLQADQLHSASGMKLKCTLLCCCTHSARSDFTVTLQICPTDASQRWVQVKYYNWSAAASTANCGSCTIKRTIPHLVLDSSDVSLSPPVHLSRKVPHGQCAVEQLARLLLRTPAVAIENPCKLTRFLGEKEYAKQIKYTPSLALITTDQVHVITRSPNLFIARV